MPQRDGIATAAQRHGGAGVGAARAKISIKRRLTVFQERRVKSKE